MDALHVHSAAQRVALRQCSDLLGMKPMEVAAQLPIGKTRVRGHPAGADRGTHHAPCGPGTYDEIAAIT